MIYKTDDLKRMKLFYSEARLGDLLRATYGSVGNSPTKAVLHLGLDAEPRAPSQIRKDAMELCLGVGPDGLEAHGIRHHALYNADAYLSRCMAELKRPGRGKPLKTHMVESDGRYRKGPDGFIFGDTIACISLASSVGGYGTSYTVMGNARSKEGRDTQSSTLLLMRLLAEMGPGEYKFMRLADALYEGDDRKDAALNIQTLRRLDRAGVIEFGECSEPFVYRAVRRALDPEDDVKQLQAMNVPRSAVRRYRTLAPRVMKNLRGSMTSAQVAARLGLESVSDVGSALAAMRRLGYVRTESPGKEASFGVRVTEATMRYYSDFLEEPLEAMGMEEAVGAAGIREAALDRIVRPDVRAFLDLRRGWVDPYVTDGGFDEEFQEVCRESIRRQQRESTFISGSAHVI